MSECMHRRQYQYPSQACIRFINCHALAPLFRYTDAIKEMMRQRAVMAVEAGRRKTADVDIMWKPNETQVRVLKVRRWGEGEGDIPVCLWSTKGIGGCLAGCLVSVFGSLQKGR